MIVCQPLKPSEALGLSLQDILSTGLSKMHAQLVLQLVSWLLLAEDKALLAASYLWHRHS